MRCISAKSFGLQIKTLLRGGTTAILQTGYQRFKTIRTVVYVMLPDRHEARTGHIHTKQKVIPRTEEKVDGLRQQINLLKNANEAKLDSTKLIGIAREKEERIKDVQKLHRKEKEINLKVLDIEESRIQEEQDGNMVMFRLNNPKRYFVQ